MRILENEISTFPKLPESLAFQIILNFHYRLILRLVMVRDVKVSWNLNSHFFNFKYEKYTKTQSTSIVFEQTQHGNYYLFLLSRYNTVKMQHFGKLNSFLVYLISHY